MPSFVDLLLCYGICFGLMNKVDALRSVPFFDRMLSCSYCTGFHAGWMSWVLTRLVYGFGFSLAVDAPELLQKSVGHAMLWAFVSAAFCYVLDTLSQLADGWVPREKE